MDYTNTWKYHQTDNRDHLKNAARRLRFVTKEINKISDIKKTLDIGFGDGQLLNLLAKKYDTHGIDFVQENIALARKATGLGDNIKFGNSTSIPFEENSFDLVTATEILEHLSEEELKKSLNEISRVLVPGGYLVLTVPYKEKLSEKNTCCPNCGTTFHIWGHQQSFNDENIPKKFGNGFTIVKIQRTIPMGESQNLFGWIESIGRLVMKKYKGYLIILKSNKS
jgi:ubiquinone/menaquinone biosynthesis C-methylase UbiE